MEGAAVAEPIAIEDVRDVVAFANWRAQAALGKRGDLTADQLEQAGEEALVLIYELKERWDPARCPRFSAFLLSYLDRALIDWWRRELRQSGRGTWSGSAGAYRYYGMVSLDDLPADRDGDDGPAQAKTDRSLIVHPAHA
jgi:hypothetical protein